LNKRTSWLLFGASAIMLAFAVVHMVQRVGNSTQAAESAQQRVAREIADRKAELARDRQAIVARIEGLHKAGDDAAALQLAGRVAAAADAAGVVYVCEIMPPGDDPLVLVAPSTSQDPGHRLLESALRGLADAPVEGFGEGFRVEREAVGAGEHEAVVVVGDTEQQFLLRTRRAEASSAAAEGKLALSDCFRRRLIPPDRSVSRRPSWTGRAATCDRETSALLYASFSC